jgi:hypothetical protein
MLRVRALSAIFLLSMGACGGSDSVTGTTANCVTTKTISAAIDGTAWCSPAAGVSRAGSNSNTIIAIAGIDLGLTASISIGVVASAPGTFSVGFGNSTFGSATVTKSGKGWSSALQGGTGSVTFTTLTANHVVGTFAFDAVAASGGATGTVHVTGGKFDITF